MSTTVNSPATEGAAADESRLPSLDTLIRRALDASPSPEPADCIEFVIDQIQPEDAYQYLRQAIVARLSSIVGAGRRGSTPEIRKGVSTKQTLIRDQYWPNFLRQRIFLPTGTKFLADATSEDLRFAAQQRSAQAKELAFRASQFSILAQLMDENGAETLEDLGQERGMSGLDSAK